MLAAATVTAPAAGQGGGEPVTRAEMLSWRLSPGGLGPIRVGMRVAAVERATGRAVERLHGSRPCSLWEVEGAPRGLFLMTTNGRVVRVDVSRGGRWVTGRGVGLSDDEDAVRDAYPRARTRPHPYVRGGLYLIVGGGERRLIFETGNRGGITSMRGGQTPQVGYIEGCA